MNPFVNAKIYHTQGVDSVAKESDEFRAQLIISLGRFYNQDWGEISGEDKESNKEALKYKDRVVASYETAKGEIWIIAESDEKIDYDKITVLFPSEY